MDDGAPATRRHISVAAVLGILGCIGIVAGWFLPWMTYSTEVSNAFSFSREDLERMDRDLAAKGESASLRDAVRKLLAGEPVNGADWAAILAHGTQEPGRASRDPQEARAFHAVLWIVRLMPWIAGALALWLLLLGARGVPGVAACVLQTVGFLIGGTAGLLLLGSSQQAKEKLAENPLTLGVGITTLAAGGALALVAGVFGVRRGNWWQVFLVALLLSGAVAYGTYLYVRG